jgi:hypothetical protein
MFTVNRHPSTTDLRKFAAAMVIGFGVIGAVVWCAPYLGAWWRGEERSTAMLAWAGILRQWVAIGLWALGAALCIGGLMPKPIATKVYVGWMRLVTPIGIGMSMVMLTLVYFIFLPVFALIVRRSDPLRLKNRGERSYWQDAKPAPKTIEDMMRFS